MIKKENLYAETVITESPFFYDENGRLRVRVLEEESVRGPEDIQTQQLVPMPSAGAGEVTSTVSNGVPPIPTMKPKAELKALKKQKKEMKFAGKSIDPSMKEKIMAAKQKLMANRVKKSTPPPGMEKNPDYVDRFSGGKIGTMDRRPSDEKFRPKQPGAIPAEKTDMPVRTAIPKRPGLIGPAVMVRDPRNPGNQISWQEAQRRKQGGGMKKEPARPGAGGGFKPLPPAKPGVGRGPVPLPVPRPGAGTDRALPMPSDERTPTVQPKRPVGKPLRSFRFSNQSRIGAGRNINTRQGLRTVGPANRNMMEDSRPATDYIQEKMDLKAAEMGDVIRDFQKSDAPQFKGKSKEKRRMMAVAAKLQADRG
jgi:hypothetical protein